MSKLEELKRQLANLEQQYKDLRKEIRVAEAEEETERYKRGEIPFCLGLKVRILPGYIEQEGIPVDGEVWFVGDVDLEDKTCAVKKRGKYTSVPFQFLEVTDDDRTP